VDRAATRSVLVVSSARLLAAPSEGVPLVRVRDGVAAAGFATKYNPESSPGLSITIPSGKAILYGSGRMKSFAKSVPDHLLCWTWVRDVLPEYLPFDASTVSCACEPL
jgi:hypothetical protein